MLVLFETPAGHALFKMLDDSALRNAGDMDFESPDKIKGLVKLRAFSKFKDTTAALAAATALVEGKPSKDLRKFLKKEVSSSEEIAVGDAKLGAAIKEKTGLKCVFSQEVNDLMRGIRSNLETLLQGESGVGGDGARKAMVLGLAHSLSRYKLKFSPDKVDTMIVQAIGLLDELDKEINTYSMRLREWYGWHFPELGKIIIENVPYARVVNKMGIRPNAKEMDFSDVIPEETEDEMKQAAQISMGTEISEEDVLNIRLLCDQVITLSEYRNTLFEYLQNRMAAIAPNLTAMVGELVGARLIAHAGSLLSLAKYPASTVQILGAEKALFRALKTKHATPKYGLIYHASVVGQAGPKHKGKISRSLASKCALAIRVDALGDVDSGASVGESGRLAVEARLRRLEGKSTFAISKLPKSEGHAKYKSPSLPGKTYNADGDMVMKDSPEKEVDDAVATPAKEQLQNGKEHDAEASGSDADAHAKAEKKRLKKEKKRKKRESLAEVDGAKAEGDDGKTLAKEDLEGSTTKKDKKDKKDKKRRRQSTGDVGTSEELSEKKKKKKRRKSEGHA